MMKLVQAETAEQIDNVRRMLREYEASLGVSLCFQGFGWRYKIASTTC